MNSPIDTYRAAFLLFMAEGMNYDEALQQFDEEEFSRLAWQEMDTGEAVREIGEHGFALGEHVTNDSRQLPALWTLLIRAQHERHNGADSPDFQQALELWAAGWKSENANPVSPGFWGQTQVMSWYWRRPPRRVDSKGMLFLSTQQAFNALKREQDSTLTK